ncbi:TRAP transporter small permease [Devosia sp.]|uniref:TRAP transporter small permease n=1 Tax=Devosia sp. TaxID=1871048 RepID=UPI00292E9908|nr:TRAP transporter small permease subunit [Devosia sp.]
MKAVISTLRNMAEGVSALMMAAIFCTFILQIIVRYAVGAPWFVSTFGNAINASYFGWTLEFILVLWLWTIFWGNAFVVRDYDHVTFGIIYDSVGRKTRSALAIIGALIIAAALLSSIGPTYDRMKLLWLKSSATLPVKMLPIYSIYFVFLAAVSLRYLLRAWNCVRRGADGELHGPLSEVPIHVESKK